MKDGISRRQFNQLFAGIFAFLCGMKVEADPEPQDHTGFKTDRIEDAVPEDWKLWEKSFSEVWKRKNKPCAGVNYGHGMLQDIMLGIVVYQKPKDFDPWMTPRERKICATLIQWLGTNCGRSFLYEVQNEARRRVGGKPKLL
jgi:hypothetical protein